MMRWAGLLAIFAAGPAVALSCLPYTFEHAWADATAATSTYVVAYGALHFDEKLLPEGDFDGHREAPPLTRIPARFNGMVLTEAGFTDPTELRITLEIQCFGPWCASVRDDGVYLAFLEQRGPDWVLATNPCGGFAFFDPSPELLDRARACRAGADCQPEPWP